MAEFVQVELRPATARALLGEIEAAIENWLGNDAESDAALAVLIEGRAALRAALRSPGGRS